MNRHLMHQIILNYPFIFPRLYVFIRSLIIPVHQLEIYVPQKGKILDVGCGYGLVSLYLALSAVGRNILATDINSKRISVAGLAAGKLSNLQFKVADLVPQGKYDCILGVDLFHHLSLVDKRTFASLCRKSLSKNGILILKEINPANRYKYFVNLVHDRITTGFRHLEYWPASKMINFFSNYGFKITSITDLKHPLYPHNIYVFQ
jgi:2-polyprenyl-3-methyl-5-hydroxy-6-metoxy-1,4-benzoquinol methylase